MPFFLIATPVFGDPPPIFYKSTYLPLHWFYKKMFQVKIFSWRIFCIFGHYKNSILSNFCAPNLKNVFIKMLKIELFSYIIKILNVAQNQWSCKAFKIKFYIQHIKTNTPLPQTTPPSHTDVRSKWFDPVCGLKNFIVEYNRDL